MANKKSFNDDYDLCDKKEVNKSDDRKIIQSYVYSKNGKVYFVSTIKRIGTIGNEGQPEYYETITSSLDIKGRNEDMLSSKTTYSIETAFKQHLIECQLVFELNEIV